MKTRFMVASAIGLLGIASIVLGATTFASTGTGKMMGYDGSGAKMMRNRDYMMHKFASTGEAQAFRTAVDQAITDSDYTAFVAAHTKYSITNYMTKDEFTKIATERVNQQKSRDALKSGDYATRKTLNKDNPIATKIDTEAKFKKLQEMNTYQEKINTIIQELGLEGPKDGIGELKGEGDGLGMRFDMGKGMERGRGMERGTNIGPRDGSGTRQ